MGSANCREKIDVGPIIETVFELNYMLFALHTIDAFAFISKLFNFGIWIIQLTVLTFLHIHMFKLGGVIDCAI